MCLKGRNGGLMPRQESLESADRPLKCQLNFSRVQRVLYRLGLQTHTQVWYRPPAKMHLLGGR